MYSRLLGAGAAVAIAAGGCGQEAAPQKDPFAHQKSETERVIHNSTYTNLGYEFPGVEVSKLRHVAGFSITAAGIPHTINAFAEDFPLTPAKQAAGIYRDTQRGIIEFAKRFKSFTLPMNKPASNTSETVRATLNVSRNPSMLVLTGNKDFTTPGQAQMAEYPAAATFTPPGLSTKKDIISFVEARKKRPYFDPVSLGTEACQAAIKVGTDSAETEQTSQEVVCNSLGLAYGFALAGYSFQQYFAQTGKVPRIKTPHGNTISFFVLPEDAYNQFHDKKTPRKIKDIRSAVYTAPEVG